MSNSKEPCETEQILGRSPATSPGEAAGAKEIAPEWQKHYRKLLQARDDLLTEHQHFDSDALQFDAKDMMQSDVESATDESTRDFALGMLSNYQDRLEEIEAALHRIEDGTYGICERSGEPIPEERLDAVPWTRFSTDAEADAEAKGDAPIEPPKAGKAQQFGPSFIRIHPGKAEE
ncbi:TraR/DksA family transcriptional regulator [Verrucomicrobiota bacterium sgz303538]